MPFNPVLCARTTAWKNNCAFHCLAHFLTDELESHSVEALSKQYSEGAYKIFLKAFAKMYSIPKTTLPFLKTLLQQYPSPIDREAIFGPVLRLCLAEVLKGQSSENLAPIFYSDVLVYLSTPKGPFSNPYLILANKEWLESLAAKYQVDVSEFAQEYPGVTPCVEFFVTPETIREYWLSTGAKKHADYLGDSNQGATISPEEFSTLTQAFDVGLRVYSEQNLDTPQYPIPADRFKQNRILTVFNGGKHWEYEASISSVAAAHNIPYQAIDTINTLRNHSIYPDRKRIKDIAEATGAAFISILISQDQSLISANINTAIQASYIASTMEAHTDPSHYFAATDHKKREEPKQAAAAAARASKSSSALDDGIRVRPSVADDGIRVRSSVVDDGIRVRPSVADDGIRVRSSVVDDGIRVRPSVPLESTAADDTIPLRATSPKSNTFFEETKIEAEAATHADEQAAYIRFLEERVRTLEATVRQYEMERTRWNAPDLGLAQSARSQAHAKPAPASARASTGRSVLTAHDLDRSRQTHSAKNASNSARDGHASHARPVPAAAPKVKAKASNGATTYRVPGHAPSSFRNGNAGHHPASARVSDAAAGHRPASAAKPHATLKSQLNGSVR